MSAYGREVSEAAASDRLEAQERDENHYHADGNAHGWWVIARGAQTPVVDDLTMNQAYAVAVVLETLRRAAQVNADTVNAQALVIRAQAARYQHALHGLNAVIFRAQVYRDDEGWTAASDLSAIAKNAAIRAEVK